jgi:hypothetical protein
MMVHAYINYTPFLKALEDHIAFFVNSNEHFRHKTIEHICELPIRSFQAQFYQSTPSLNHASSRSIHSLP